MAYITRDRFSVNGSGVKVGVIADGIKDRQVVQTAGELPSINTVHAGDPNGNEGTAMLEIVYDIAPSSQLYFAGLNLATDGPNVMASRIDALWNNGCRVIVDDIGYSDEPFFSDQSALGTAIRNFISYGNTYVSAAGNDAQRLYNSSTNFFGTDSLHRFSGSADSVTFTLPASTNTEVVLQWASNWLFPEMDIDLYVFNSAGQRVGSGGTTRQNANNPPFERVTGVSSGSSSQTFTVRIKWYGGSQQNGIEFSLWIPQGTTTNSGTRHIFGHPAYPNVISVAAYHFDNQNSLATYSSKGPSSMYVSQPTGQWTTQNTPAITATSKVKTYVGITGLWPPGNPYFEGTSASAPHMAGIAALYYERFPSKNNQDFFNDLTSTATTIATGSGGTWNNQSGYGKANAYEAVIKGLPVLNNPNVTANTSWNGVRITGTAQISNGAQVVVPSG
ncbi:MAG: S8 family serine peptidase, partial [Bacteroidota bacterium]